MHMFNCAHNTELLESNNRNMFVFESYIYSLQDFAVFSSVILYSFKFYVILKC